MKRKLPQLKTNRQAENFVRDSDLTTYDLGDLKPVRFEFARKEARVNMRLPEALLDAVKQAAARDGMPYQRFIRLALERALHGRR